MKVKTLSRSGFTLVEIMIVVAIIALLASVAIPSYVHARESSQRNGCINNLRQIDGAAQTWALEHNKAPTDTYTLDDIKPYIRLDSNNSLPLCPANGTYSPGTTVGQYPTCTIPGHLMP